MELDPTFRLHALPYVCQPILGWERLTDMAYRYDRSVAHTDFSNYCDVCLENARTIALRSIFSWETLATEPTQLVSFKAEANRAVREWKFLLFDLDNETYIRAHGWS